MNSSIENLRVDRGAFSVTTIGEEPSDLAYWLERTPEQRLHAVELMRQVMFGYAPDTERLQRILEIAERPRR
ncbi:MAG TPA: hypothetical protein VM074_13085 [Solimonas sp.]|nr:hypothetical protein [Solimonas sp.]